MSPTELVFMGLWVSILLTWLTILLKILQFAKARRALSRSVSSGSTLLRPGLFPIALGQSLTDVYSPLLLSSRNHEIAGSYSRKKSPLRVIEKSLNQQVEQEVHRMEQGLTVLACIGSVTPFVGLLGTVLGIMEALGSLASSNSATLGHVAGPIGHALLTTAVGIASAVPAVLAYNGVIRWIRLYQSDLQGYVNQCLISYYRQCHRAGQVEPESDN